MKKIFTIAACSISALSMQAQDIRVNLTDGTQAIYAKDKVKSVDFVPAEYKGKIHYATTDMTFAEFYAGELQQSADVLAQDGVDVVTSATSGKSSRFTASVVSEDGHQITGVKAVSVSMTDEVFKSLSEEQKKRFTFVEDSVFASSKQLLANGTFSAYTAAPVVVDNITVSLSSGSLSKYGNYTLSLSVDRNSIPSGKLQGAVLTTTSGQKFALFPLSNLWLNTAEIAFSVKDFTEPHGNHPNFSHTAGLQGKTISNITYYLKDMDNVSIPCNVYVKQQTIASVAVDGAAVAGENPIVPLLMSDVPEDANYTIASVKKGTGKQAKALAADEYSYADGILTIKGNVADGENYDVAFNSDKYVSIGTSVKFGTQIAPTELQQKLKGTYVELFSDRGTTAAKWDDLWIAECKKYVGEENAEASANMLKHSMLGNITGPEATKKYGDGSTGFTADMQFSCHFLNGVDKLVFDGVNIKGVDAEGKDVFSHDYVKVGYDASGFHIYKSVDGNDDAFTYFFLFPDNPIDTYHIEFRYGNKIDGIAAYTTGEYAYWMAAGVLEGDDKQCEEAIRLFVGENLSGKK